MQDNLLGKLASLLHRAIHKQVQPGMPTFDRMVLKLNRFPCSRRSRRRVPTWTAERAEAVSQPEQQARAGRTAWACTKQTAYI